MKTTYDQLVPIVISSIEASLGVTEEGLACIDESPLSYFGIDGNVDLGFDQGVDVYVEFDDISFMSKYYNGSKLTMFFNVTGGKASISAFIGSDCSNPEIANDFTDRYVEHSKYLETWYPPNMCDRGCGLMLVSDFCFGTAKELGEEFVKRLRLFADERFTNELRPFIHYFED